MCLCRSAADAALRAVEAAHDVHACVKQAEADSVARTTAANRVLLDLRKSREASDERKHAALATTHVRHEIDNPFLREDTRQAVSATNPHR